MPYMIDLNTSHSSRKHGDIMVVFTWVNDERAMVLIPHRRRNSPWYIVMDSAVAEWDDRSPESVPMVARKAMHACSFLGIEPTPRNAQRIATIIIDSLPDLILMPGNPPDIGEAIAGEISFNGGSAVPLKVDPKPKGVEYDIG